MKHKLSEIINTDCYVQFDTNEQLREWVKLTGLKIVGGIFDEDLYIFPYHTDKLISIPEALNHIPIHHHTNISI